MTKFSRTLGPHSYRSGSGRVEEKSPAADEEGFPKYLVYDQTSDWMSRVKEFKLRALAIAAVRVFVLDHDPRAELEQHFSTEWVARNCVVVRVTSALGELLTSQV